MLTCSRMPILALHLGDLVSTSGIVHPGLLDTSTAVLHGEMASTQSVVQAGEVVCTSSGMQTKQPTIRSQAFRAHSSLRVVLANPNRLPPDSAASVIPPFTAQPGVQVETMNLTTPLNFF